MNPRSFVVMSLSETTIAAIATAPGTAALGIIRMSGPQSIYIADRIFPSKQVSGALGTTLHYGKIIKEDGALVDEVLLSVFKAPHSYTGEDLIEISCHGSPYILQQMLKNQGNLP
jgi:tRNA modification GTPase